MENGLLSYDVKCYWKIDYATSNVVLIHCYECGLDVIHL